MDRYVVISPHPDDEAIGCGGTILQHTAAGDSVDVVFLTSGESGGHSLAPEKVREVREREAEVAAGILHVRSLEFWGLPDGHVAVTEQLVHRLRDKLVQMKPRAVYVTHPLESHPDHRAAAALVVSAVEELAAERPFVYMYEVWTPTPNIDHIVDISDVIESKIEAVRAYRSQCDVLRFDEAVRGLNRYRGEMHSWPGGPYAEVYQVPKLKQS